MSASTERPERTAGQSDSPDTPNALVAGASMLWARRVSRPAPTAGRGPDHAALVPVLEAVAAGGVPRLRDAVPDINAYRQRLEVIDPDSLARGHALAYWLNLYNAGALLLAAEAANAGEASVLRVRAGFRRPWARVAGERLSLDDIEHGKVRRFGDPRVHGALVCGSASCPTLRFEPFDGDTVDEQLEDQMRRFVTGGAVVPDRGSDTLFMSRIFLWYGGDFTRPHRMPAILPGSKRSLRHAVARWLEPDLAGWVRSARPAVKFQEYDWALSCSVAGRPSGPGTAI